MNVAATVPALPSVTVTSLIESAGGGSSSVIVPTPWPSAIVAFDGARQVDEERLVRSRRARSPLTGTVNVWRRLAGGEGDGVAGSARVVAGRPSRVVGRGGSRPSPSGRWRRSG